MPSCCQEMTPLKKELCNPDACPSWYTHRADTSRLDSDLVAKAAEGQPVPEEENSLLVFKRGWGPCCQPVENPTASAGARGLRAHGIPVLVSSAQLILPVWVGFKYRDEPL